MAIPPGYTSQANRPWMPMPGLNNALAPALNQGGNVNNAMRYERDVLVPYLQNRWGHWTPAQRQ